MSIPAAVLVQPVVAVKSWRSTLSACSPLRSRCVRTRTDCRVCLFPVCLLVFFLLSLSQRRPSHRAPAKGKGMKGGRGRPKGSGSITQSLRFVLCHVSSSVLLPVQDCKIAMCYNMYEYTAAVYRYRCTGTQTGGKVPNKSIVSADV